MNKVGFKQSKTDKCLFYQEKTMHCFLTDDSMLAGPDKNEINKIIEDIKKAKLDTTIEGDLQGFLGTNVERKDDGAMHLTQPHLIDQMINDLWLNKNNAKLKDTPNGIIKINVNSFKLTRF